jgi:hypothetical protein
VQYRYEPHRNWTKVTITCARKLCIWNNANTAGRSRAEQGGIRLTAHQGFTSEYKAKQIIATSPRIS